MNVDLVGNCMHESATPPLAGCPFFFFVQAPGRLTHARDWNTMGEDERQQIRRKDAKKYACA